MNLEPQQPPEPPVKKETPAERKAKERKYKSKTQRKREWNPRAWAKKNLKDQGGMPTEQIRGMTSPEIDEYWKNAITCEKCVQEGKRYVRSKTGYLKLIISKKFPFISKKWFCADCYESVGGILLGFGDLGKVEPIKLSEKFPERYCSECGRIKKGRNHDDREKIRNAWKKS